jgi:hypothetical protein
MHSAEGMAGFFAKAWVLLDPSELIRVEWYLLSTDIGNGISL